MRPLEAIFVAAAFAALAARWSRPRTRQTTASLLGMLVILLLLHLVFDGVRWEMIPAYALGVAAGVIFAGDLRRIAGAKAGASARWKALPSPMRRASYGAALLATTAAAVIVGGWIFPRVHFPRPDGFYDVGRIEVFWTDSTRDETLTSDPRDKRGVWVTFWYPADSPAGRALRYHPSPGVLAGDLVRAQPFPRFIFWNLTTARTNSTRAPRFSIREGRSPLLLFSHGFEGTRVQNTYEFETLASNGYVVASIEHTYAAIGTVLPDGRHATSRGRELMRSSAGRRSLLELWADDAKFVLDRLHALPMKDASDTLSGHLQLDRIGYFGHSFGGIAAAELMARDLRVKAGINMDGVPFGRAEESGLDRPFLVFTSPPEALQTALRSFGDTVLQTARERDQRIASLLKFGGTEIRMDGAAHASFSDLTLWSPPLARRAHIAGADDPQAVHQAVTTLTLRFFDQYLKGRTAEKSVELPSDVKVRVIRHEPKAKP